MSVAPNRRTIVTGAAALLALTATGCTSTRSGSAAPATTGGPGPRSANSMSPGTTSASPAATASPSPTEIRTLTVTPRPSPPGTPLGPSEPVDLHANPKGIIARSTVPILGYHQIRGYQASDSAVDRTYIIPPAAFAMQLRALADAGYQTISPDRLLAHLTTGADLPDKPVIISFDDTDEDGFRIGVPEMARYRFTGTYFIMTVAIGKLPHYMTADQIRRLDGTGHTVAAHTWDHHRVDRYSGKDWQIQLVRPAQELAKLLGHPVRHFGYPFGAWAPDGFPHLQAAGYQTAFQLQDHAMSKVRPLYTIRRAIANPRWNRTELLRAVGTGWS